MRSAITFDHITVGSGQATGTLVSGLQDDSSVAVVEDGAVVGMCVNVGCSPTKTVVASARAAHMARRTGEYGVTPGEVGIDFANANGRMNESRRGRRDGLTGMLEEKSDVTLFRGRAHFEGPRVIRIGDIRIEREFWCTSTSTPGRGFRTSPASTGCRDSTTPDSSTTGGSRALVVVGGSYVGLECVADVRALRFAGDDPSVGPVDHAAGRRRRRPGRAAHPRA